MIVYHVTKSRGIRVHILLDITFILIKNNRKTFEKNKNIFFLILPIQKKANLKWPKNYLLYPNLTTRCQKVEKISRPDELKLLVNFSG